MTTLKVNPSSTECAADPAIRIGRLERSCTALWSAEPPLDAPDRARLLRQLADVERQLLSLSLQLVVDPDRISDLDQKLRRCERRLNAFHRIWARADRMSAA